MEKAQELYDFICRNVELPDTPQKQWDSVVERINEISESGYLVVYEDGYESWSPKEAFDKVYRPVETFTERLHVEATQLDQRIIKLQDFIHSDKFKDLELWERESLYEQIALMRVYYNIVIQRYHRHTQPTPCCCGCAE